MALEIKSGVPIDARKAGPVSKFESLLAMKKGDSVALDSRGDANAAQMFLSRNDIGATVRKQKDGTFMLWRVF